jgi:hypothetical protein
MYLFFILNMPSVLRGTQGPTVRVHIARKLVIAHYEVFYGIKKSN